MYCLFVVGRLSFVVCCLLCDVYCLSYDVCLYVMCVVNHVLVDALCLLRSVCVVRCLLIAVLHDGCLLFVL